MPVAVLVTLKLFVLISPLTRTSQINQSAQAIISDEKQKSKNRARLIVPVAITQKPKATNALIRAQPIPIPGLSTPIQLATPSQLVTPRLKIPQPQQDILKIPRGPPPFAGFGRKEKEPRKSRKKNPNAFVGNVSDVEITRGFNRGEIITGIKRSAKRYQKNKDTGKLETPKVNVS